MGATGVIDPQAGTSAQATGGGNFNTEKFTTAYGFRVKTDKNDQPVKDEKGNIIKEAVVLDTEKAEKLSDDNMFEGSTVNVAVEYPSTFKGLLELANRSTKDEEGTLRDQKDVQAEIVRVFVAGAKIKVNNDLKAMLTKVDEKGNLSFNEETDTTDGVLDLSSSITRGSRRIFLTEEQKVWKGLSNLPADTKKAVWSAYLTQTGKAFY